RRGGPPSCSSRWSACGGSSRGASWSRRTSYRRPGAVWDTMVADWAMLLEHTWVTTMETVVGFVLAAVIGVATAVVLVYSPTAEKSLYPLILFAQVIPKIAIAPILVVWFGFGATPKIVLAVLIAFFPVVVSAVAGLRSIDPELL